MNGTVNGLPTSRLYLLSLTSGFGHVSDYTLNTAVNIGRCVHGEAMVLHRFKVTGKNELLLVVRETGHNTVDTLVQRRLSKQLTVNYCTPLLDYETFARSLGVEIPDGNPQELENGKFHWLEVTIEFPGKTEAELLRVWKEEAALTVKAQRMNPMTVYKAVGARKVHVFNASSPEYADKVSFSLSITVALGGSVSIRTKAVDRF